MPGVRDDREAPLLWGRDGGSSRIDLGQLKTTIFLQAGLDSQMTDLPVGQITERRAPGVILRADQKPYDFKDRMPDAKLISDDVGGTHER